MLDAAPGGAAWQIACYVIFGLILVGGVSFVIWWKRRQDGKRAEKVKVAMQRLERFHRAR